MIELKEGMTIYHGSYIEVKEPDINKCALYKDFGRGFYLTSSKIQANNFAILSTLKAISSRIIANEQGYGIVSSFNVKNIQSLKKIIFDSANREWLHFVVGHRKKNTFNQIVDEFKDFDLIGGKIANDSTNATINAYMANTFGDIGSDTADRICIELLLPNRLENQFCFRTNIALDSLEFLGSEKVWMKK